MKKFKSPAIPRHKKSARKSDRPQVAAMAIAHVDKFQRDGIEFEAARVNGQFMLVHDGKINNRVQFTPA